MAAKGNRISTSGIADISVITLAIRVYIRRAVATTLLSFLPPLSYLPKDSTPFINSLPAGQDPLPYLHFCHGAGASVRSHHNDHANIVAESDRSTQRRVCATWHSTQARSGSAAYSKPQSYIPQLSGQFPAHELRDMDIIGDGHAYPEGCVRDRWRRRVWCFDERTGYRDHTGKLVWLL